MKLAAGGGVIAREPSESLSHELSLLKQKVAKQADAVRQADERFQRALSGDIHPEQQLALKSAFDLESMRLTHLEQELRGKQAAADWAFGQRTEFAQRQKLEADFTVATERLNKSRAAIEELKQLNRDLPNRMADAERTFRVALQGYNEAKSAVSASKWQRASHESQ